MKEQKKKVPDLRFKGFTDDWEQRKLGDTVNSIVAGGDIDKSKIQENGKYPVYANALTNDGVIGYYNDQYRVKAPAVTVTGRGEIGVAKTRNTNFTPVVRLLAINSMHNNYFLENLINTHRAFAESTGVPQLTAPQLANYKLKFPKSIEEESKIGNFFNNLDSLITLQQRKLDLLNQLKKGLLQKMFADKDSKRPILRFNGFTDDWEERKLGDVTDIKTGSRNHQDSVENGKYPFFVRSEKIERLDEYDFDTTAILIPGDGRIGEIFHYYDGKFALHQRVYKVDNFNGIDVLFLLSLFRYSFRRHALRLNAQGTVPSLRLPMFTKWEILLPKLEEQEKIGQLFQSLDKTITLHDKKIQYLKQLKRGLLQKMFM